MPIEPKKCCEKCYIELTYKEAMVRNNCKDASCPCHASELPSEPKECKCICHKGINPYQKQENWSRAGHSPQLCFCHHKQRLEKIVDKVNEDQRKFMETPEPQNESWESRFDKIVSIKDAHGNDSELWIAPMFRNFILQELSRAEQAGRDKLLKELDITKDFKGAEIKRIKEQAKQERTREIIERIEKLAIKQGGDGVHQTAILAIADILSHLQSYLKSTPRE